MRVGIVCPYSFDVPGGVQFHVRDLAERSSARAPRVACSRPPTTTPRCRRMSCRRPRRAGAATTGRSPGWTSARSPRPGCAGGSREGDFDVLHLHEPVTPSLSMLALWAATARSSRPSTRRNLRSRAMQAAYPILRPSLEKIAARIAVSEDARRTLVEHLGGDAVVIPNGVYVDRFAPPRRGPSGRARRSGRRSASSAGSTSRARACPSSPRRVPAVLAARPGRAVARRGPRRRRRGARAAGAASTARRCEFLGPGRDDDKARCCARSTSMSPRTPAARASASCSSRRWRRERRCVASDLAAFRAGARRRRGRGDVPRPGTPTTWRRRSRRCSDAPERARPAVGRRPRSGAALRLGRVAGAGAGRLRDGRRGRPVGRGRLGGGACSTASWRG